MADLKAFAEQLVNLTVKEVLKNINIKQEQDSLIFNVHTNNTT